MPLIIITGLPSCGKSKIAEALEIYFTKEKLQSVTVVSENSFIHQDKNELYSDSKNEKILRGNLMSEVTRLISSKNLVIFDGLNYIKGFRYELYCISKQYKTTHCVVQCLTPIETAWSWNEKREEKEKYSRTTFDGLIQRYEAPDNRNRWDRPMFSVIPTENQLQMEEIFTALFVCKPPPPNQSTQVQHISSSNYLLQLDKCTQELVIDIMKIQKTIPEGEIKISNSSETLICNQKLTLLELTRHRRQFITYHKAHPVDDLLKIRDLFVQYLNRTINID